MADTPFLGITLLEEAQSSKETTINEGFETVDTFLAEPTFTDTVTVDVPLAHAAPIQTWAKDGVTEVEIDSDGDLSTGNVFFSVLRGGGAIPAPSFGQNTITPGTDADVTVGSPASLDPIQILVTGAWTTGRNVILPTKTGAVYIVHNTTAFTATFKTAAGTGAAVPTGKHAIIRCGGVNFVTVIVEA